LKTRELNRSDWKSIERLVTEGSKVLDLGCGDGSLLDLLIRTKNIRGRGVEIDEKNILSCLEKGISVFQSNLDEGLSDYADQSFDFVILSLTLQEVYEPKMLLQEMLRVGKEVIVSIPNFGHWSIRFRLLFRGFSPKSTHLPYEWYDSPNIRFITVTDFKNFCHSMNIEIHSVFHTSYTSHSLLDSLFTILFPNLFSEVSVFLLSKEK
jgi:methionine biosynthesis protein MetW